MTQKSQIGTSGSSSDRIEGLPKALIQLSDGTAISAVFSNNTDIVLSYILRGVATQIASFSASGATWGITPTTLKTIALVRDASDNFYLIGNESGSMRYIKWTKTGTNTWSQGSTLTITPPSGSNSGLAATWVNSTGGTSGAGHIICMCPGNWIVVLDAGSTNAGTIVTSNVNCDTTGFSASASTTGPGMLDVSNDGFGATTGLLTFVQATPRLLVASWSMNSSGVLTTTARGTVGITSASTGYRARLLRVASGRWVSIVANSSTQWKITRLTSTTVGSGVTSTGTLLTPNFDARWDAYVDPVTADTIHLLGSNYGGSNQQHVYRNTVTVAASPAAEAVYAGELQRTTMGYPELASSVPQPVLPSLRVVAQPVSTMYVDFQVYVYTSAGTNYAAAGDYESPTLPFIRSYGSQGGWTTGTSGFSPSYPNVARIDDIVFCVVVGDNGAGAVSAITTPAGWNLLGAGLGQGGTAQVYVYWQRLTANKTSSDTQSFTCTTNFSGRAYMFAMGNLPTSGNPYRNVRTNASSSTGTTVTVASGTLYAPHVLAFAAGHKSGAGPESSFSAHAFSGLSDPGIAEWVDSLGSVGVNPSLAITECYSTSSAATTATASGYSATASTSSYWSAILVDLGPTLSIDFTSAAGPVAAVNSGAPVGSLSLGRSLAGPAAAVSTGSPVGSMSLGTSASGPAAAITSGAPAGDLALTRYGPGNIGSSFWLRSDTLTEVDLDTLATWTDQSGANDHATQPTSGSRPVVRVIGGVKRVRSDGTKLMSLTNMDLLRNTTGFTLMAVVADTDGTDATRSYFFGSTPTAGNARLEAGSRSGGPKYGAAGRRADGDSTSATAGDNDIANVVRLITIVCDYTAGTLTVRDGVTKTVIGITTPWTSGSTSDTASAVMTLFTSWIGDIYEIAGWRSALSSPQLIAAEDDMGERNGLIFGYTSAAGPIAVINSAAPVGSLSTDATLAGPASAIAATAPIGTVNIDWSDEGNAAAIIIGAPVGHIDQNMAGPAAAINVAAIQGGVFLQLPPNPPTPRRVVVELMTLDGHPLPDITNVQLSPVFSQVGVVTFDYPKNGVNSDLLDGDDIELKVLLNGVEIEDMQFIIEEDGGDEAGSDEENAVWSYGGRTTLAVMERAIVYPRDGSNTKEFTANPGGILTTLIDYAQERGTIPDVTYNFDISVDSNGDAWESTLHISYDAGVNLLSVITQMVDAGVAEARMRGRVLDLFNPGGMSTDRTLGSTPVVLRRGQSLTDAPLKRSSKDLGNVILLAGAEGVTAEVLDASSVTARGRREIFESQSNVSTVGSLEYIGNLRLPTTAVTKFEKTHGLSFEEDNAPLPFEDFAVGDWVYSDTQGTLNRLRVKQWTIGINDDNTLSGSVVLNDSFDELAEQLLHKIDGIVSGSVQAGGDEVPIPEDTKAPGVPMDLAVSSDTYLDSAGQTKAIALISWSEVTYNFDLTAADDIDYYEIRYAYAGFGWSYMRTSDVFATIADRTPGKVFNVAVRAVDTKAHKGDWTATVTVTLEEDSTPPPVPSTPIIDSTTFLGTLRIKWDGLGSVGEAMPIDFDHIEVHASTVNSFTPSDTTLVDTLPTAGVAPVQSSPGTITYYRFISVDKKGNKSAASVQASGTSAQAVSADLAAKIVELGHLADLARASIQTSFMSDFASLSGWTRIGASTVAVPVSVSDAKSGGLVLRSSGGMSWYEATENIPFDPDVLYRVQFRVRVVTNPTTPDSAQRKVSAGVNGIAADGATYVDRSGTNALTNQHYFAASADTPATGTTWTTYVGYFKGSSGSGSGKSADPQSPGTLHSSAKYFRPTFLVNSNGGNGVTEVDMMMVEILEFPANIIGTVQIADATIVNAKIANLAVDDAKIGSMSVGKLTAGSLIADVTVSARIKTANTGARVELNTLGLEAYDSSGTQTVFISAADGSGIFTGRLKTAELGYGTIIADASTSVYWWIHGTQTNWPSLKMTYPGITASGFLAVSPPTYGTSGHPGIELVSPRNGTYAAGIYLEGSASSGGGAALTAVQIWADSIELFGLSASVPMFHCTMDMSLIGSLAAVDEVTSDTYLSAPALRVGGTSAAAVTFYETSTSFADRVAHILCDTTGSTSWDFLRMTSANSTSPDREFTFNGNGNGKCDGSWTGGGADYAELFETVSGKPIPPGTPLVLEGAKVRPAKKGEDAFAVVSTAPSVLGNDPLNWPGKYVRDEFGRKMVKNGTPVLAPTYDETEEYIPRSQRPEWVPVALLGQVPALDDGTCVVGGYATMGKTGLLTKSIAGGWRVLERRSGSVIVVLVR